MIRVLALIIFLLSSIYSQETSSSLTRQKLEVLELKKELTSFYEEKESEYQENKKELEDILTQIEKEKKEIKELHDKNALLLKEINLEIESKTAKIYNNLKAKSAATIFDNMIADGKVDDVFAIMLRIKEIQATQILKFLTVENSSLITHMLEEYKLKYGQKD